MSKLVVVLGATGKQVQENRDGVNIFEGTNVSKGGSVIDRFLKDPEYKVRGVSRDPTTKSSQALVARGVEVVQGDLLDLESLKAALKGANVVYGITTDL
jgi:putative NADH-flavin reductase